MKGVILRSTNARLPRALSVATLAADAVRWVWRAAAPSPLLQVKMLLLLLSAPWRRSEGPGTLKDSRTIDNAVLWNNKFNLSVIFMPSEGKRRERRKTFSAMTSPSAARSKAGEVLDLPGRRMHLRETLPGNSGGLSLFARSQPELTAGSCCHCF